MNEFYVYALIDPRNKSIFYIGKGKGKRYLEHEKNLKHENNLGKNERIKDILHSGNKLDYKIIAKNLDEESAFLLEKILVHRLGREIFNEGILSNLTPGGKRHKDSSYFLNDSEIPNDLFITQNFSNLVEILKLYPSQSQLFAGLSSFDNPANNPIYVYNYRGEKITPFNINEFVLVYEFENLVKQLAKTDIPIYAWRKIWSKNNYDKLYDYSFSKIANESDTGKIDLTGRPINIGDEFKELLFDLQDFDEIVLNKEVLNCIISKGTIAYCENYINGKRKFEFNIKNGLLNGDKKYFYDNGFLKYEIAYLEGKRHGMFNLYNESGQLIKTETYRYGKKEGARSDKRFYDNGNIRSEIESCSTSFYSGIHRRWYLNNILQEEIDYTDGVENKIVKSYNKKGEISTIKKYKNYKLKKEIDYKKGKKNKIVKSYNKKGIILKTEIWIEGKKQ